MRLSPLQKKKKKKKKKKIEDSLVDGPKRDNDKQHDKSSRSSRQECNEHSKAMMINSFIIEIN